MSNHYDDIAIDIAAKHNELDRRKNRHPFGRLPLTKRLLHHTLRRLRLYDKLVDSGFIRRRGVFVERLYGVSIGRWADCDAHPRLAALDNLWLYTISHRSPLALAVSARGHDNFFRRDDVYGRHRHNIGPAYSGSKAYSSATPVVGQCQDGDNIGSASSRTDSC